MYLAFIAGLSSLLALERVHQSSTQSNKNFDFNFPEKQKLRDKKFKFALIKLKATGSKRYFLSYSYKKLEKT